MRRPTAEEEQNELAALGALVLGKQFLADIGDGERAHQEHITHLRQQIADLRDAANCAWALLPDEGRALMQTNYPRLAELASDGYASAEDAQAQAIREATEEPA